MRTKNLFKLWFRMVNIVLGNFYSNFCYIQNLRILWFFEGTHKIQTNVAPTIMVIGKMCTLQNLLEKYLSTRFAAWIRNQFEILKLLICWIFRCLNSDTYGGNRARGSFYYSWTRLYPHTSPLSMLMLFLEQSMAYFSLSNVVNLEK